eukprot:6268121-Prymnesium_polylepis.1
MPSYERQEPDTSLRFRYLPQCRETRLVPCADFRRSEFRPTEAGRARTSPRSCMQLPVRVSI